MEFITNWVTQIIIFLLLAAIIDLLIPNNVMKKYIQFVVALILILIFLKPIFSLLNINIQEQIEQAFKQDLTRTEVVDDFEESINIKKGEIESSQDAYILEEMAVQLIEIAQAPIESEFGLVVNDIDFIFAQPEIYTFENLEEMIVYINGANNHKDVVNEIDDVTIDTNKNNSSSNKTSDINEEEIKSKLKEVWELEDMKITLSMEGGGL